MEELNLVKCGKELVEMLIKYLAKDALGGEFLRSFTETYRLQEDAVKKQEESLALLKNETSSMSEKTKETATHNLENLNEIVEAIKKLQVSVDKIGTDQKLYEEKFNSLIQQSKTISGKINDIQNISQQTNLLSFNASIEAARAGVAGKGFRVIANEVKKLSNDTSKTSEEIKHNMDNVTASIKNLEALSKDNSENFAKLAHETAETIQRFEYIKELNAQNLRNVTTIVDSNTAQIDNVLQSISKSDDNNKENVRLFASCASKNEMLFNDLYSFVYQLKAIFADLPE